MTDKVTDDELMQAIAEHDRNAFTDLVARHLDRLYAYAHRLSPTTTIAEDLVQDTWLIVWERADRYEPGKVNFTTWLFRVLHNRYIDGTRKHQPTYDTEIVEREYVENEPSMDIEALRRQRLFHKALDALPGDQRAALLLARVQGFSNSQVAHIMGTSIRAVESLQARGKRGLINYVEQAAKSAHEG